MTSAPAPAPLCTGTISRYLGWAVPLLTLALALAACSPSMDWRQVKPPDWGLSVSLPCRPASQARTVQLAGQRVEMTVMACSEGGHTYAMASANMGAPDQVAPALAALVAAAQANVQGAIQAQAAASVPGMTPQAMARHLSLQGRLPDGQAVREQVLVFARGLRVYQITLLGPQADAALAKPLFESIEVQP